MSLNYNSLQNDWGSHKLSVDSLINEIDVKKIISDAILSSKNASDFRLISVTIPFERIDPLAALELLGNPDGFEFYWEHPDESLAMAAGGESAKIRTNTRDRFENVRQQIEEIKSKTYCCESISHSLAGIHFLGGLSFQEDQQKYHWRDFGNGAFIVPEWMIIRDGELSLLTVTQNVNSETSADELLNNLRSRLQTIIDEIVSFKDNTGVGCNGHSNNTFDFQADHKESAKKQWINAVLDAKERIADQQFEKIVLAREVIVRYKEEPGPTRMLNFLRNEYPTCFSFMMRVNRHSVFLGSTPEKLVSLRASFLLTDGLAGTISRGKTASEDTVLERQLLRSNKDLQEHKFVVEAIGERLKSLTHSMRHPEQPGIRKYQNVQHLYTPITASMNDGVTPFDVVEKLHPTPAVGGYPREKAIGHIQNLEQIDRGWYAGPVGWLNTNGRGEFCVAIRSGLLSQGHARFFAGCGIVADSVAESEWNETELKFIPMLTALSHA
jgi:menaquinone-specific isochorismate synthase